ncbi:hypothetical protein [Bordetella sp. BOR01]|uniref:hypothetical protein n=1 Tax=Bordetella sp. BOR01 TaxID=2854779 RepID=UPI001C472AA4|nr:hypothetical protein [Bordetella sp. BOR01]MBV7482643.1 hypothetical protein [Bordetella sp. BOR01]
MFRPVSLGPLLAVIAIGGCGTPHHAAAPDGPAVPRAAAVHTDKLYGFRMQIPAGVTPRPDFSGGYLAAAQWKAYAGPDSRGVPRLALALPGSNQVTSAELRIGVSDDAQEARRCAQPPEGMAGQVDKVSINGIDYARFRAQDAAMSHYLVVDAYRTVHAGRCYALDLMVYGVNPQVYSPPATPPFSQDQALQQLRAWLDGFAFVP